MFAHSELHRMLDELCPTKEAEQLCPGAYYLSVQHDAEPLVKESPMSALTQGILLPAATAHLL